MNGATDVTPALFPSRGACYAKGPMASARAMTVAGVLLLACQAGCGGGESSQLGVPPKMCSTVAVNAGLTAEMEPGGDCVGCHAQGGGAPELLIGGTVMAALHDDTNCAGIAGVTVRLTGADGNVLEMTTNGTGNFFKLKSEATLALPFHAEISRAGKTSKMLTAQSDTNCMSCHTAAGAKLAIGRIVP